MRGRGACVFLRGGNVEKRIEGKGLKLMKTALGSVGTKAVKCKETGKEGE